MSGWNFRRVIWLVLTGRRHVSVNFDSIIFSLYCSRDKGAVRIVRSWSKEMERGSWNEYASVWGVWEFHAVLPSAAAQQILCQIVLFLVVMCRLLPAEFGYIVS